MFPTKQNSEAKPRAAATRQEQLLTQLGRAARQCEEVERLLGQNPPPELETLIKLHRVLLLKFSLEANVAPQMLKLVTALMKPMLDWARLQEKRKERELAEQKYRDEREAQKAANGRDDNPAGKALRPETLAKIERELKLL